MTNRVIYVVANESGEIIASANENVGSGRVKAQIIAGPRQKLFKIENIPDHIANLEKPSSILAELTKQFHASGALTKHFQASGTKVTLISSG